MGYTGIPSKWQCYWKNDELMWFTLSSHFGVAYFQTCLCQNFVAGSKIAVCRFNAPKTAKVLGPPKTLPNRYMSTVTVTSSNNIPIKPHIQSQKMFGAVGPMFFHIFALAPWHVSPLKIPGFTSSPSDFCLLATCELGSVEWQFTAMGSYTFSRWKGVDNRLACQQNRGLWLTPPTNLCLSVCVCVDICVYIYMYIYMYICICICIYICIYVYR